MTSVVEARQADPLVAEGPSLARSSGLILLLSLVTLGLGFAVQVALAARLGTSRAMDAYLVAITLPTLGATVAHTAFPSALVPVLRGRVARGDLAAADSIFRTALIVSGAAGLAMAIGFSWGASTLVQFTAPGLGPVSAEVAAGLLSITAFGLAFDFPRAVLGAREYARDRYWVPQLAPSLNHLLLLVAVVALLPQMGLGVMAAAWMAGSAAMFALLIPSAIRPLVRAGVGRPSWSGLGAMPAVLLVALLSQAVSLVDRGVGSTLPEGAISALGYGSKILDVLMRTIPMGVVLALFPILSERASRGNWEQFREVAEKGARWMIKAGIPVALLVTLLRQPAIVLLFERGAFDRESSLHVAQALLWYGIAFLPACGFYFTTYVYYALQEPWMLVRVGTVSLLATAALDWTLAQRFGLSGIAASSVIVLTLSGAFLAWRAQRRGLLGLPRLGARSILKIVFPAVLMGGILLGAARAAEAIAAERFLLLVVLGLGSLVAFLVYTLGLVFLGDADAVRFVEWARARPQFQRLRRVLR